LIEEFGQKYRRFFAILEAIARGKNRHHEIVSELGI
jgi:AAA+ ATPase superfamily predicted ATPase